jgi:hypothetical protein
MCVTCLFEDHDLFTSLNINIQYKHNQIGQTIEKGWFNILDLLRYCDERDMAKDCGLEMIHFLKLERQDKMIGERWAI